MFWRDSGAIHCSIYKRCIAATIARIWIPNSGHLRSVDMSARGWRPFQVYIRSIISVQRNKQINNVT